MPKIQQPEAGDDRPKLLFLKSSCKRPWRAFQNKAVPLKLKFQEKRESPAVISGAADAPGRHLGTCTWAGDAFGDTDHPELLPQARPPGARSALPPPKPAQGGASRTGGGRTNVPKACASLPGLSRGSRPSSLPSLSVPPAPPPAWGSPQGWFVPWGPEAVRRLHWRRGGGAKTQGLGPRTPRAETPGHRARVPWESGVARTGRRRRPHGDGGTGQRRSCP